MSYEPPRNAAETEVRLLDELIVSLTAQRAEAARLLGRTAAKVSEYDAGRPVDALRPPLRREISFPAVVSAVHYGEAVWPSVTPQVMILTRLGKAEVHLLAIHIGQQPCGVTLSLTSDGTLSVVQDRYRHVFVVPSTNEVVVSDECSWCLVTCADDLLPFEAFKNEHWAAAFLKTQNESGR